MPVKKSTSKKIKAKVVSSVKYSSVPYTGFFVFLFLVSMVGFTYQYKKFLSTQASLVFPALSNVAGAKTEKAFLTVEIRSFDPNVGSSMYGYLSGDSRFKVLSVITTPNIYSKALLIDRSAGDKVELISNLENKIGVGAQTELPALEKDTTADVLILLPALN